MEPRLLNDPCASIEDKAWGLAGFGLDYLIPAKWLKTIPGFDKLDDFVLGINKGWKKGEPINNLTKKGTIPSWDAIRKRYWKNQAYYNPSMYTSDNVERMNKGLANQVFNPETGKMESMTLHHNPPIREGNLFDFRPLTPTEHAEIDPFYHLKK